MRLTRAPARARALALALVPTPPKPPLTLQGLWRFYRGNPSPIPNQGLWRFYVCALRTPPTCDVDAPGAGAGLGYQAPTRSYHSPRTA